MPHHQFVEIIGIVVQLQSNLGVGNAAGGMAIDIRNHLPHHVIMNITQLLMTDQVDQKIFELGGIFLPEENFL